MELTLLRRGSQLARPAEQVRVLESGAEFPRFADRLQQSGMEPLHAAGLQVLQVNVGKLCNQTCRHCHVDAGPERREAMSQQTAEAVLRVLAETQISTLDITGGAPEMSPQFGRLVVGARRLGRRVIDRSNLTILVAPGFNDLPEFLVRHDVAVVASLPCYLEENCDRQRGDGVFAQSIEALQSLNRLGYGAADGPELTLVYNPAGPALPPPQATLEQAYRDQLRSRYGIEFTRLYTITNLPISRFLDGLLAAGQYEAYLQKLVEAFNPGAVENVMCRTMVSVDWQGRLYDCDFNQMLELPMAEGLPRTIEEFASQPLAARSIATGRHCFGCTAGAGSSCTGQLV